MILKDGQVRRKGRRSKLVWLNHGGHISQIRDPMVMAATVVRVGERRLAFEAAQGVPVVHVKDGKPLTAHGAKLLGVEWPPVV